MPVDAFTAIVSAVAILGLRRFAGRLNRTSDRPNLWTGLSVMSVAWAFDLGGALVFYGILFALIGGAVIRWRNSDHSLNVSLDVSRDED